MSLSRVVICETGPWNRLNLLYCTEGQVWIKNWIYLDEKNRENGYEKLLRYDIEKKEISEVYIGNSNYVILNSNKTKKFLYIVRKLSFNNREKDLKNGSISLIRINLVTYELEELLDFSNYIKNIRYMKISKVLKDIYILLEICYLTEEGDEDTRRNTVLIYNYISKNLSELIDKSEDEFYEGSYGLAVKNDKMYFFLTRGEENSFSDADNNQSEIEIFELEDSRCKLLLDSYRLVKFPKGTYWNFKKSVNNGKLLFNSKSWDLKGQIYTSIVTFDVKKESLYTLCKFNKGLNIKSTFVSDDYIYVILDNSDDLSDEECFKHKSYKSMLIKSSVKESEQDYEYFDLNVEEEIIPLNFNVFDDKIAVFTSYSEKEVDGYSKKAQKVYTYDIINEKLTCIYTTYDYESDPYGQIIKGRGKNLMYISDMLPESNMEKNRELYLKYNLSPLTPQMIFEFELD